MRARDFWKAIVALLVWGCSVLPAGAQGVGAISGTISDTSGAVIPGVAITLSSPQATIGANQQAVTDERGAYQFLRLVPGTYIVKAELQGFRPGEQNNIIVSADQTARADLKLQVGTLAEGVTVTGEAPLLDTTSALKQTVLEVDTIKALPNRFDVWSAARVAPGVVMSQVDVGGTAAFLQSGPTLHGSSSENGYFVDGMDISNMEGNASGAAFYLDTTSFQEMNLQMGAAGSASADRGGLVFNMITKTGTNSWHGGAQYAGASAGLNSDNLTPALRTALLPSVPAIVLAANPNFQPEGRIKDIFDSGSWLSGPIVRDRLWFSFSQKYDALNQFVIGSYNPSGTQVLEDDLKWTVSGKVAWQMTKSAQLSYFDNLQYRRVGHRPTVGTFADSNSRSFNTKYPDVQQVKFTTPWTSHAVLDASFSQFRYDDSWLPETGVVLGTVSHYETTTDAYTNAVPTYTDDNDRRDQFLTSISFFSGKHDISAGYQLRLVSQIGGYISTSGMRANFTSGVPVSVNTYDVPISATKGPAQYTVWDRTNAVYVQDKWTPTKRLVVNAGLRFQTDYGWSPATCSANNVFVTGTCQSQINDVPNFKEYMPRVSAVYDLMGDGKTAVKFAANRYTTPISLNNALTVNPAFVTASDTRSWTACAPGQTSGCDLNGDGLPQLNELGPSNGYSFGAEKQWAPGLKAAYSNEYSVELQHQLPGNIVVSGGYTYRFQGNQFAFRNILVPPSSYIPLTVTEASSGRTLTVYNQSPTTKGMFLDVYANDPEDNVEYHGGDILVNKRMSNGWSLMGGASFGKTIGDVLGGDLNNPNSAAYRRGRFGNDVPWSYRMSGVFDLPFGIASSATSSYYAGFPQLTTVTVNSKTVLLTQSSQSVVVEPRGTERFQSTFQLDASLRRPIKLQKTTLEPRIDFYNLTNENAISAAVTVLGPGYGLPSGVQRGRLIKFGMSMEF